MRLASLTVSMIAPMILFVLLVGAAGCGSESDSDSGGAGEAGTQLEITFWPQGRAQGNPESWTLSCDPPGGTHPRPADACARLDALDAPFAPPPTDEICTELYGGPEEALIEGTYRGESVSYELARTNGCEIARFEKLSFLLAGGVRA